ncbi:hypothetical protein JCM10914A_19640 [Paenibacillus sp. JCM 10914]|uniref:tubby C-terminal domain-like protein n=1 Tax=Paenibacillus sp. JCM 10914 TaxID=1236974 RepID=UPI000568B445|nr:hypothetical protein [Paenibacillus sp. JCM 10914]
MKLCYEIPKYSASVKKISVMDHENKLWGVMQRYNPNKLLESCRHISPNFVLNVLGHSQISRDVYEVKLQNQFKAFVTTASWTIYKNDEAIGTIKEKAIGRALVIDVEGESIQAISKLSHLREVNFHTGHEELAKSRRNLSFVQPTLEISIYIEKLSIDPFLFALFSFIHNNQSK